MQLDTGATCNILHSRIKLAVLTILLNLDKWHRLAMLRRRIYETNRQSYLQCKFNHKIYDLNSQVEDTHIRNILNPLKLIVQLTVCMWTYVKLFKGQEESLYSSFTEEEIKSEFRDCIWRHRMSPWGFPPKSRSNSSTSETCAQKITNSPTEKTDGQVKSTGEHG